MLFEIIIFSLRVRMKMNSAKKERKTPFSFMEGNVSKTVLYVLLLHPETNQYERIVLNHKNLTLT